MDKTVNRFIIAIYMPKMCRRNSVLLNWKNDALLADAEFREYLAENIVVGDFACDGAQVVDDLADVFA